MRRHGQSVVGAAVLVSALLVGALSALASESGSSGEASATVQRSVAGLEVTVDPSTGRLVPPTPAQRARLAAALVQMIDHRTEGLEVRRLPDGTRLVDLQGRFQNVEVAVRGQAGDLRLQCVKSPDEIDPVLEPSSATEER